MPLNVSRLRYWFAVSAIAVVLIVAGFYFYARYRYFTAVKEVPKKLGIDIQQSTDTFSLSKSEGGRTLFTIRASKAVQYKEGGKAELHDVNIIVYGRQSDRFDQIYGSDFEYDQATGNVVAKGDVNIDLEGNAAGQVAGSQAPPPELKNPIHLKTSGLVFNQKTGLAQTDRKVEFQIPHATGSAVGANYDSKSNVLTLASDVNFSTVGPQAASITARHGTLTKDPRRAVFDYARMQRGAQEMSANKVTLFLRDDNSIEHVLAQGNVRTAATGQTSVVANAPAAEFLMTDKNLLQSAVMRGGVEMESTGAHLVNAHAERVTMDFDAEAKLRKVHATGGVRLLKLPAGSADTANAATVTLASAVTHNGQTQREAKARDQIELTAPTVDVYVRNGKVLDRAETSGSSQITIQPTGTAKADSRTVITAENFTARFDDNRMSAIHGAPNARVVQSTPGQPDKISTSQQLDATFDPAGNVSGFVQQGGFQYREGASGARVDRAAWSDKATYNSLTQILTLEGSPRVVDGGMTTTAQQIRLNRRTGGAEAQFDVKTTYSELQQQPNGAMLASSDPVHVTAANMTLRRADNVARYSGGARLWQAGNIIEAPIIVFDRGRRSVNAEGSSRGRVSTVLVQQGRNGSSAPVSIAADNFTYTDNQRSALFKGNVLMRGSDATVTANQVQAFLQARQTGKGSPSAVTKSPAPLAGAAGPSQLEKAVAEGNVVVQEPNRRATGQKLVYTASDQKFVLTGGPPSIFDAERGTVTGTSLTFYSGDDRVLVQGGDKGRTVTTTRVSK